MKTNQLRFYALAVLLSVGIGDSDARAFWMDPAAPAPQSLFLSPPPLPEAQAILSLPQAPLGDLPAAEGGDWVLCGQQVELAERLLGLPSRLLLSIAKAESGRATPDRRAVSAWPWTVMAEGRGRYLPTREAAIAEVREIQSRGVRNIDVGCMQINLRYHPDAFESLEQAFDPAFNVAYGAVFLSDLYQRLGSWTAAVGRYHSATPEFSTRYRARVLELWEREQRAEARRLAEGGTPASPASAPQTAQLPAAGAPETPAAPSPLALPPVDPAAALGAASPLPRPASAAGPAGPGAIGWR